MTEHTHPIAAPFGRSPIRRSDGVTDLQVSTDSSFDQDNDSEGLDLSSILRVFWSFRYWILAAGALGFAIALAYSLLQTPLYRSTALIELNPPVVPVMNGAGTGDEMVVPNTDWEFNATQYGLLKSRQLAERVVQDLNLASSKDNTDKRKAQERILAAAGKLAANISVAPEPDSRLVKLTYTSASPGEAQRIVNAYADAYLSSSLDRRFEATAKARDFLQKRLATVRAELDDSERKLVRYAKANQLIAVTSGSGDDQRTSSLSGASLESLNSALAAAQQRRIAAEGRFRQAGSITETNQSTASLRSEKAGLEAEYREKSTYLQDGYPDMVRLRSRINALDQEIAKAAGSSERSLRAEYQAALTEEKALQAKVQQLSSNVLDERERSIQYNIFQRELDTNRSLYAALLERFNEVGVAGGVGRAQASIVDRGQVPGAPFTPQIPRNLLLGVILGLGLGAGLAFLYDFLTDTIKTPGDVREKLRLPLLGVVPKLARKEALSEQLADPKTPLSEAYTSLLSTLQFSTNKGFPSSLVVTSARAAEGKSTTSFVLANALAKQGMKVVMVDGDMRKPSFVVEERSDLGLSRLLVSNENVDDHLVKTRIDNLWLLPGGPVPPNPAQILHSVRAEAVLAELQESFDIVIIDAPPAQGFADAPLLGSICDGVLLIVESGRTRRQVALEAIAKLQSLGSKVIGVGLTKYQSSAGEYGYSYKYYEYQKALTKKPHELSAGLLRNDAD